MDPSRCGGGWNRRRLPAPHVVRPDDCARQSRCCRHRAAAGGDRGHGCCPRQRASAAVGRIRELGAWQTVSWALMVAAPLMIALTVISAIRQPPTGSPIEWAAFAYLGVVRARSSDSSPGTAGSRSGRWHRSARSNWSNPCRPSPGRPCCCVNNSPGPPSEFEGASRPCAVEESRDSSSTHGRRSRLCPTEDGPEVGGRGEGAVFVGTVRAQAGIDEGVGDGGG